MIAIQLNSALLAYLIVTMLGILGVWLWWHWKQKKRKISITEEKLTACEFCTFAYLAPRGKDISRCPQCRSFNKN